VGLLAATALAAALVGRSSSGLYEAADASRRAQVVVDLSYDDDLPNIRVAPPAKPINLIELGEGDDDAEHGTHQLDLGHDGVLFGVEEAEAQKESLAEALDDDLGPDENGGVGVAKLKGKRAPVLNADALMDEASPMDDGPHTTFFVCHQHHDIQNLPAMQMTKVEPIITREPHLNFDNSVVHHMSIFLCTEDEAKNGNIGRCEEGKHPVVPTDTMHKPCYRMAYAYDRDAKPFVFPKDVGVRVGKGTPYTRIVQEWHYLLPKTGLREHKFADKSRFKVTLSKNLRKHNAAMIGTMNMRMHLPPGQPNVHHQWECNQNKMEKMLGHDWDKFGKLTVMSVHLHAHNRAKKLWWDHLRNGKKIGEFGRFDQYKGYGPDESFMHLDAKLNEGRSTNPTFKPGTAPNTPGGQLERGDTLRTNCIFDTRDRSEVTIYGTNHGEEMCGNLMMYYPHDWTQIKHHENTCIDEFTPYPNKNSP